MCGASIAIITISVNEISARISFHVSAAEKTIIILEANNESAISKNGEMPKRWFEGWLSFVLSQWRSRVQPIC